MRQGPVTPGPVTGEMLDAFTRQGRACRRAGSPLYGAVLDEIVADLARGGPCAAVLSAGGTPGGDPLATAVPLRFLAGLHRLVLSGAAPGLAAHFPSAGGVPGAGLPSAVVDAVAGGAEAVARWLGDPVQTNEVGRSAALVGGFCRVAERTGLPLRILEVGASAGLNLRFDRYWYDTGRCDLGDPASAVRFEPGWWQRAPRLVPLRVVDRAGCDLAPLDPGDPDDVLRLRSYVWPDQLERLARLDAALAVAASAPVRVDAADAVDWLEVELADRHEGVATVVVHSIVLQYLEPARRLALEHLVRGAGRSAPETAPVAWLCLEPAGARAELRLDLWPGEPGAVLADVDYHGRPVEWTA